MNKMRQPLLFATGTFFAVMLAVFGILDIMYTQDNDPNFSTQTNTTSAGQYSCYSIAAPGLDESKIQVFVVEGEEVELEYPLSLDDFLVVSKEHGYNINYLSEEQKVYLDKAFEGIYQLKWKLPNGANSSAKFVEVECLE